MLNSNFEKLYITPKSRLNVFSRSISKYERPDTFSLIVVINLQVDLLCLMFVPVCGAPSDGF